MVLGDFNAGQRFNQTTPESEMGIIRGFQTATTEDDLFDVHERLGGADRETHVGGKELDRILLSPSVVSGGRWELAVVSTQRNLAIRGTPDQGSGVSYTLPVAERDLSDHFPLMVTLTSPGEPDTEPQAPTREQLLRAVGALEVQFQSLAEQLAALKALVEQLQE